MENLENIIESVLFVAGDPIPITDLCFKFNVDKKEINKAIEKLQERYDGASGIKLMKFNNKLQFSSNPDYVDYIAAVLNPIRQRNLTKATLETAAIIAYKQPITRTEIEETRGVNSDYALNILLEHKLVEIVGKKDAVGRPSLFGTTDEFLKRFGIESISDLPDYNELMDNIQRLRGNYSESLFNRFEPVLPNEEDMDKKLEDLSKVNDENKKYEEATSESIVIGEHVPVSNKPDEQVEEDEEFNQELDQRLAEHSGVGEELDILLKLKAEINEESSIEEPKVQVAEIETTSINLDNSLAHNNSPVMSTFEIDNEAIKIGTAESLKDSLLDDYLESYLDKSPKNSESEPYNSFTEFDEDDESELDRKIASLNFDDDIDKRLAALSNQSSNNDDLKSPDVL